VTGSDLARRAIDQARRFGVTFLLAHEAVALHDHDGILGIVLADGSEIRANSVVVACGVSYRTIDVPGAERLTGCGVYYGASVSDTSVAQDEDVCIVGGANSAGQAALHLSNVARSVTMIVRGDSLTAGMSKYLVERIARQTNIHVRLRTTVSALHGEQRLESLAVHDMRTGNEETINAVALFVFIGAVPRTAWLDGAVARDERGFIFTGPDVAAHGASRPRAWTLDRDPYLLETDMPGVFAAGDVRHGAGRRVATAVGEGAMAVMSIWQHRAHRGLVPTLPPNGSATASSPST
jgi:thioredoxin reductase (NADPH)